MTLEDVIDQLKGAELSNLFTFDDDSQTIDEVSRAKLIPQLNLGLTLLHKRFFLKEGTELVNLVPDQYTYSLKNPDVLRIERVRDLDDNEYVLDDEHEPESLLRTNYRTLKVPKTLEPVTLEVIYRAGAEKVPSHAATMEPAFVTVDLPDTYLDPLVYFIASRFLNPMGASDGLHEGNNYAAKYEQACQMLERQNFDLDRTGGDDRFLSNGWV